MANRALDRKKAIRWARHAARLVRLVGPPEHITQTFENIVNREQGTYFAVLRQASRG